MYFAMGFLSFLFSFICIGFGYIVWVFACKEKNSVKVLGQTIAIIIIVLSVLNLFYFSFYGARWRFYPHMQPGMHMRIR